MATLNFAQAASCAMRRSRIRVRFWVRLRRCRKRSISDTSNPFGGCPFRRERIRERPFPRGRFAFVDGLGGLRLGIGGNNARSATRTIGDPFGYLRFRPTHRVEPEFPGRGKRSGTNPAPDGDPREASAPFDLRIPQHLIVAGDPTCWPSPLPHGAVVVRRFLLRHDPTSMTARRRKSPQRGEPQQSMEKNSFRN